MDFIESLVPKHQMVPVSMCDTQFFNSQKCEEMKMQEYQDYWRKLCSSKSSTVSPKYLKDWHFYRDCPNYKAYETPEYFCSDWLNEFCERDEAPQKDDYRFVYIGPAGSWTPLHFDVFGSFSWSANIVGQKHWILFPPDEKLHLCDPRGQLLYDVEDSTTRGLPQMSQIRRRFDVIQNEGDVIFVPSLWIHQVRNVRPTISINHNWFNGANISVIVEEILAALKDVQAEIQDCRVGSSDQEWDELCEKVLKGNHGMSVGDLICLLEYVGKRRVQCLEGTIQVSFDGRALTQNHCTFDLIAIVKALKHIQTNEISPKIHSSTIAKLLTRFEPKI
ncbi:hypothetical protein TCAL_01405 [Tigriopus californicus]|uniref:Jumonji domain-containing protein 4 n=2 Tax=Tigriopus californicus TaxID=6832 RepID=A0A553NSD5_TIGCA|nr:hypothetical protein TCAL_01405 [Tigriopus californicus]